MNEAVRIAQGSRPLVRDRPNRWAPWAFAGVTAIGAILLYASLESAREARIAGRNDARGADVAPARPLPELVVPRAVDTTLSTEPVFAPREAIRLQPSPVVSAPPRAVVYRSVPAPAPAYVPPLSPVIYPPAVTPAPPPEFSASEAKSDAARAGSARASKLASPSFTIVQGTLIPAVLETALDSSSPGPARAMVSRDVRSFDREHILIPRGSKLIGEFASQGVSGQNRAAVTWTRLIRPDGVSIDLKSPAADALGRSGVPARVNNHLVRRFGEAILQTLVGVGTGLTQRAVTQPIIVVPNGAQPTAINLTSGSTIQPTLTVKQGSRISVFVARDLDFADVEQPPQ